MDDYEKEYGDVRMNKCQFQFCRNNSEIIHNDLPHQKLKGKSIGLCNEHFEAHCDGKLDYEKIKEV